MLKHLLFHMTAVIFLVWTVIFYFILSASIDQSPSIRNRWIESNLLLVRKWIPVYIFLAFCRYIVVLSFCLVYILCWNWCKYFDAKIIQAKEVPLWAWCTCCAEIDVDPPHSNSEQDVSRANHGCIQCFLSHVFRCALKSW